MTAAELAAKIAAVYPAVQGRHAAYCQTREPYELFVERGVMADESVCCDRMLKAFVAYATEWDLKHAGEERPTLYWRYDPPHIFWYASDEPNAPANPSALRCRLVLSNLPVVAETEEEYDARRTAELEQETAHGLQRQPYQPADQEQRDRTDSSAS